MSRRSKPYDWLGIETAFSGRDVENAIKEGLETLPKFDPPYFRQFVEKIRSYMAKYKDENIALIDQWLSKAEALTNDTLNILTEARKEMREHYKMTLN